jgi:hypothetical protein
MEEMATNQMLQTLKPGLRPFIVGRSTFAGIVSTLEPGAGGTRLIKHREGNRLIGSVTTTRHGEYSSPPSPLGSRRGSLTMSGRT